MAQLLSRNKYYHADGRRIELLQADDLMAVDEQLFDGSSVPAAVKEQLRNIAKRLSKDVWLVHRHTVSAEIEALLQKFGAPQPVFLANHALIIPRPEVRVEETRPDKQQLLKEWLRSHRKDVVVLSQKDGRLVLAPASGHGEDALAMANALAEEVSPEMAQARFLRVVNFETY